MNLPGLNHAVSGQEHGTGPGNIAANKGLGNGEVIAVPRLEYLRLQEEVTALRSKLPGQNGLAEQVQKTLAPLTSKGFRKAIAGGAMYVGSLIIAPGAIAAAGLAAEVNLTLGHIEETKAKYPEFEYSTMHKYPEQEKYFLDLYGSKMFLHYPLGLIGTGGILVSASGIITAPIMGIAKIINKLSKKKS